MLFDINKEQLALINDSLDITIKHVGIKGGYKIMELARTFNTPGEEGGRVELAETQIAEISDVLDVTIRQVGLQGLNNIVKLVALFNNPVVEEEATEVEAVEEVEVEVIPAP